MSGRRAILILRGRTREKLKIPEDQENENSAKVVDGNKLLREGLLITPLTEAHESNTVKKFNRRFNNSIAKFGKAGPRSGHARARKMPQLVGNRKKRRNFQGKAYLTALEENPERTSQRVIDDKPLINEESFPEGTFEFLEGLFEMRSKTYLESSQEGQLKILGGLTITFTVKEVSAFLGKMKDKTQA